MMERPGTTEQEFARRLLAHHDSSSLSAYDTLNERLAPIIGLAGMRALFARSIKLARLAGVTLADDLGAPSAGSPGQQLHDYLEQHPPEQRAEIAMVVFATFIALLGRFIGERLTMQVLHGAWSVARETDK